MIAYDEPMRQSRLYENGRVSETNFDLDRVASIKVRPNTFFWIDLIAPTEAELQFLGRELQLNKLALDDAFRGRQRPKLEHYESHLFINAYATAFDRATRELTDQEIAIFVTANGIITVRDDESFDIEAICKRWDESSELANHGVAFLLWGALDVIVDAYFDAVDSLDLEIEALEELMFSSNRIDVQIQKRTYELRKALVLLRRITVPMREVLNPLVKQDTRLLGSGMFPYFQDVYDHVIRVADWTDSLRDLITTLLETNLTIQGNNMNLIMKKVTSWAAIIAVPTAVTGFYGQNIPYFGFGTEGGVWASTGLMIGLSTALYITFKRKDWL